ncbi:MAG TPA: hypothetical protein VNB22_08585 [Pyrinomonadaceae bacterium]|jgi:hypothetical protein|nr:hypothetical protein [Pyrinomonadaceae bacterium]
MKYFALFFIAITFFIGCEIKSSKDRLEGLTEEQKQRLDKRIPPEVREVLDKSDEITISYNVDKDTMQLRVLMSETVPNTQANVSDPSLKKQFLDSFYSDASSNSNGASCFSPRHRVKAKYETKVVEIDICYECGRFRGKSPSGDFGGGLAYQSEKSSAIMDAIIEKYGTKIK